MSTPTTWRPNLTPAQAAIFESNAPLLIFGNPVSDRPGWVESEFRKLAKPEPVSFPIHFDEPFPEWAVAWMEGRASVLPARKSAAEEYDKLLGGSRCGCGECHPSV